MEIYAEISPLATIIAPNVRVISRLIKLLSFALFPKLNRCATAS
jgi:hypothetical protein